MDSEFWLKRWRDNQTGFHLGEPNPLLVKYFSRLQLEKGSRIFVPLCGKTLDIAWFLSCGYRVTGAELSKLAVEQLFSELEIKPEISQSGQSIHYSAQNLDIYAGDVFDLSREGVGIIDAVYDRAAIIALPGPVRIKYTSHIRSVTETAPQLIITYEYDPGLMSGPPFSVNESELKKHYQNYYEISVLESIDLPPDDRRDFDRIERVYLLK